MDKFQNYKPLRNLLRKYNLQASLEDLWRYAQMLSKNLPMEHIWVNNEAVPVSNFVYAWDIPVICRELVLNATSEGTKRLKTWTEFSAVVGAVRQVDDAIAKDQAAEDVLMSLMPVVQQQFPWQRKHHLNELMRALKIYSAPDVDALLVRETGIPARVWFFVGFAIAGAMAKEAGVSANQNYEFVGITRAQSDLVYQRIATTFNELKTVTQSEQQYDDRWKFTLNPMLRWPLLSLIPGQPHLLHCPIPSYVLQRVSSGLYYEIVRTQGFDKPFGSAFEAYVGEVLHITFPQPQFTIQAEQRYRVGKDEKLTTDWILSDAQATVFLECKAKRMTPVGKVSADPEVLTKEVSDLAKAVVQVYKSISDARKGLTPWHPNGLPVYPVVLTLEDWYLFGPLVDLLRCEVEARMSVAKLDISWLTEMPYSVLSCADFESVSPTMAHAGLGQFFERRFAGEESRWLFLDYAQKYFPEVYRATAHRILFEDEWRSVFPQAALPKSFDQNPVTS
jgi:hypothetical protein